MQVHSPREWQSATRAVAAGSEEHDPAFGGGVGHKIENGAVTEFFIGSYVADHSPVRALVGLKLFVCNQAGGGSVLTDLNDSAASDVGHEIGRKPPDREMPVRRITRLTGR
jgi:hypothetical protein